MTTNSRSVKDKLYLIDFIDDHMDRVDIFAIHRAVDNVWSEFVPEIKAEKNQDRKHCKKIRGRFKKWCPQAVRQLYEERERARTELLKLREDRTRAPNVWILAITTVSFGMEKAEKSLQTIARYAGVSEHALLKKYIRKAAA